MALDQLADFSLDVGLYTQQAVEAEAFAVMAADARTMNSIEGNHKFMKAALRTGLAVLTVAGIAKGALSNGNTDPLPGGEAASSVIATLDTPTTILLGDNAKLIVSENLNAAKQETAYGISSAGTCSPYSRADVEQMRSGEKALPTEDILHAETAMLRQNPDVAKNMAKDAEARFGYMFDAAGVERPSAHPDMPGEQLAQVFEKMDTGKLTSATQIQNTFCDAQGNIHSYRIATLEAGTFQAGFAIDKEFVDDKTGKKMLQLKNGHTIEKPAKGKIVEVLQADGTKVMILATNKAGADLTNDGTPNAGCMNFEEEVPFTPVNKKVKTHVTTTLPNVTTSSTVPETTTSSTVVTTTSSTVPESSTTTSSTVPESSTTTSTSTTSTTVPESSTTTSSSTTSTTEFIGPKQNPHPPVTGGSTTTVEAPKPGPSIPTTSTTSTTERHPDSTTTTVDRTTDSTVPAGGIPA